MIINNNFNNRVNRAEYFKTANTKQQAPQNKKYSPNFNGVGAGIGGFVSYLVADVIGIVIGVGSTDSFFRSKNLQYAKEFGLKVLKKNHPNELKNIENLTREVVLDLRAFKNNKTTKRLAASVKKSYEKSFATELFIGKEHLEPKERNLNTLLPNYSKLKTTIDDLFVSMDNQDRYTSIARSYLKTLDKIQNFY